MGRRDAVRSAIRHGNGERLTIGILSEFNCESCGKVTHPDDTNGPIGMMGGRAWVCRDCSNGKFPEEVK